VGAESRNIAGKTLSHSHNMIAPPLHLLSRKGLLLAAAALVIGLSNGCSHRPPMNRGAEAADTAVPAMSASTTFFDGKLVVEANLGRGFAGGSIGGGPGGRHGGSGGGGPRGGGPMSMGGGPGLGSGPSGGPMGGPDGSGGPGFSGGPTMHGSNQPPVALRLRLTNHSTETIEATFVLCKSELGDFAVRPEKLALAPGQTAEPESMTSRLGIPSDELILRVSLRVGGKTEQKDLVLRRPPQPEPATPPKP
jgi:hypothetical protein